MSGEHTPDGPDFRPDPSRDSFGPDSFGPDGFGPDADPSPVAEYRDPELARRLAADRVPGPSAGFWDDLDAALADEPVAGRFGSLGSARSDADAAGPETSAPGRIDRLDRGWGPPRWLSVAAAVLFVAALGGLALLLQGRSSSPIESASPSAPADGDDSGGTGPEGSGGQADGATTTFQTSTTGPQASSTTIAPTGPPPSVGMVVDYFTGDATVARIGSGRAVGFSPDDSMILMVDEAPGAGPGCEAAPLLALYAQNLSSGQRVPALGPDATIQTGGLDLAISPFGPTAAGVETRPVYWTDWCDGQRHSSKRGVLAADGTISLVEDIDEGGDDDPFHQRSATLVRLGGVGPGPWVSPDGTHLLRLDDGVASVLPAPAGADRSAGAGQPGGAGDGSPLVLVDETGGSPDVDIARWSPSGDAVALASDDSVWLWSPWTGETKVFEASRVADVVFDTSGRRLAISSWVESPETGGQGGQSGQGGQGRGDSGARLIRTLSATVLTFDGLPDPSPAPTPTQDRCSGRSIVESVDADELAEAGLPAEVVATAVAIDRAAAVCDWAALAELIDADDFTASFGGGDAVVLWQEGEARGLDPMWHLRTVLGLPWAVDGELVVWPDVFLRPDCDWSAEDYRSVEALGFDRTEAKEACEVFGSYAHYRTGIDRGGRWHFFVAGD